MVRGSENFLQQITVLAKDGAVTVDASGAAIINAADPIDPQDLATKAYVDGYEGKVKVTSLDTVSAFLVDKIYPGAGLSSTPIINPYAPELGLDFHIFKRDLPFDNTLLAGSNDNITLMGREAGLIHRLSSPGPATLTGIDTSYITIYNLIKKFYNVGTFPITIAHESLSSSANNRFLISGGADLILNPNDEVSVYYDFPVSRYRVGGVGGGSGGGDVFGPASSTDLALVRFDGATGKLIQNSVAVLDDLGGLNLGSDGYISIGDSTSSTGDVRLDLGGYITGIVNGGVEIYGADGDAGGAINLLGGQSNADDITAPAITIQAGNGTGNVVEWWGTPKGGNVDIKAGDSTNHMGGGVTILGGTSANSTPFFDPYYGGTIRIVAGATTIGHGGDVIIDGGLTQDITETAGNVYLTGGITFLVGGLAGGAYLSGGSSTNGTGGAVGLDGGDGAIGGAANISAGTSTAGDGANVTIWAGDTFGSGYDGGNVDIQSGTSYTEGSGGSITIQAREGKGAGDGGDVIIQSGAAVDTGAHGDIEIRAYQGALTVWGHGGTNIYSQDENSGYINIESEHSSIIVNNRSVNISFGEVTLYGQAVFYDGYFAVLDEREIRWYGGDNHYAGFKASATGSTQIWTLPETDGPDGYVITTDGTGILYWSQGGGGSGSQTLSQTLALGNNTSGNNVVLTAGDVLIGGGTIIASTPGNIGTPGALALGIAAGAGFDDGSLTLDGDGGYIQINAGEGYGVGAGGSVGIGAGSANGVDADGGDVYLTSGIGIGTGRGGNIQCYVMPSDGTGAGGEFQVYTGYGDEADLAFKVGANGDGYFYHDLEVSGKLTVDGLIDPTGLVLAEQFSVPGGTPSTGNYTLWVRDDGYALLTNSAGDTSILSGGASILQNLSDVLSIGNSANSQTISDLLDPINAQDAATKNYVDGYVESLGGDLSGSLPNPTVTDLSITSEEQGSVLYFDGANWVQLPPSTSGRVLTTHGIGTNPSWEQNTSSGGSLGEVFVNLFTGNKTTNDGYWVSVGGAEIDTNDFSTDGYFEAVLSSTNLSGAAQLRLFNVTTDSQIGDILEVYDSVAYISEPVTLTNGSNIYEAQLRSPDGYWVVCYNARVSFDKYMLTSPVIGEDGYVAIARFGDLTYIGGETDGYVLTWNASLETWEPQEPTGTSETPTLAEVLTESNSAGSQNIIDLLDPVNPQDAATKNYIDGYVETLGGDLSGSLPNPTVTDLTITSEEQGSVLYFDGANWVQLPPGEDGYVLTTHDTGTNPTWEEASGTGAITPPTIGENGYVPIANNGDLSYLNGGTDGYVLTWNSGTSTWVSEIAIDNFAIHDNVPGEISTITEKATPAATDLLIIEDSADSNNKKRIQISSIFSIPGLSGMMNDAFVATENQTDFTLSQSPSNDVAIMVVDGITQSSLDYTVSGTSITYSGLALSAGQAVDFWYSLGTGSGSGGSGVQFISILSGIETHDLDGWKTVGIVEITSTEFIGTATLEAVLYTSDGYADGYARLYNSTTMTQIGSDLTTTNNLPTLLSSAITLTAGSNLYELQIRVEQDGTDEFVSCGMGRIKITGSSGGGGTIGETWISPDPLGSDVNDWNPTGFSTATIVRVDAVDDGYSITGFDASATAVKKEIINVSAYDVVITNQDVGSVTTNRTISQIGGLVLAADDSMTIIYDPVTERWRVI